MNLTVFIPAYNASLYIEEAIQSILNQTFQAFEILIIDDCSSDNTVEIIKSINDNRITLIQNKINLGIVGNLNKAFELVKTKYMVRQDADDISKINRLEKLFGFMEQNKEVDICGSGFTYFPVNKTIINPLNHNEIVAGLLNKTTITHGTAIFRMESIHSNQISYRNGYDYSEDYKFFTEYYNTLKYANINESLYLYRTHDSQISKAKSDLQKAMHNKVLAEFVSIDFIENETLYNFFRPNTKLILSNDMTYLMRTYKLVLIKYENINEFRRVIRVNVKLILGHSPINFNSKIKLLLFLVRH